MLYVLMAIVGGVIGWFMWKYMQITMNMYLCIGIGVVGGLLGTLIGTWFAFAAVLLFKIVMALVGAYFLIKLASRYIKA